MRSVLGSRASIGGVLGSGRGAAATADWWLSGGVSAANAIAVYQPIGAASLAASYTNLANPGTYNAAPGVAPTWSAVTGWSGNGAAYLTTGIYPPWGGWTFIARYSNAVTGVILGASSVINSQRTVQIYPYYADNNRIYLHNGRARRTTGIRSESGVMAISGSLCYFNGSLDTVSDWFSTAESGTYGELFLVAQSLDGAPAAYFNGTIQAVAIYNTTLSAAQVAAISSAMSALTG